MDRFVLVARLKPDSRERAQELAIAESPDREDLEAAMDRYTVFLSETEVVFFFEGTDAHSAIKAIFDDPSATEIGHWLPLFDGPLHRAPEAYSWERARLS